MRPPPWPATALLLVLLAAPAAADVELALAEEFHLSQATFLSGNVTLGPGVVGLVDPVVAGPRSAALAGNLTVCPRIFEPQGVVRPIVLAGLSALGQECNGSQVYTDPVLLFGGGTRLAFAGGLGITRMPAAVLLAPFGNDTIAMTMGSSRIPLTLSPEGEESAFAATSAASSIAVLDDGEPVYYNGTSYAYLFEGRWLTLDAAAVASPVRGRFEAVVVPAGRQDMEQALEDPFSLLDAEEVLYGADAREPRSNVSALFREFGRVPSYVDGAIFGRLDGTAGGSSHSGGISLVRGERFDLARDGGRLNGVEEPTLALSPAGVSFDGGPPRQAPWAWAALLWVVALLVLLVRRRAPLRRQRLHVLWLAAMVASLAVVDLFVLQDDLGAGFLSETKDRAAPGTLLALATFDLVLVGASFLALALPVRLVVGRVVPPRWLLLGEGAVAVLWVLLPLLLPATLFALGYDLARL